LDLDTFFVSVERLVERLLVSLCERVCYRARKRGIQARTVTLKLRYADFHTISRSRTIAPTAFEQDVLPVVKRLFREGRQRKLPIRLLGVALSKLGLYTRQLQLFDQEHRLHTSIDELRKRFGYDVVHWASSSAGPAPEHKGQKPPQPQARQQVPVFREMSIPTHADSPLQHPDTHARAHAKSAKVRTQ
jgi:hypothetical protein